MATCDSAMSLKIYNEEVTRDVIGINVCKKGI